MISRFSSQATCKLGVWPCCKVLEIDMRNLRGDDWGGRHTKWYCNIRDVLLAEHSVRARVDSGLPHCRLPTSSSPSNRHPRLQSTWNQAEHRHQSLSFCSTEPTSSAVFDAHSLPSRAHRQIDTGAQPQVPLKLPTSSWPNQRRENALLFPDYVSLVKAHSWSTKA